MGPWRTRLKFSRTNASEIYASISEAFCERINASEISELTINLKGRKGFCHGRSVLLLYCQNKMLNTKINKGSDFRMIVSQIKYRFQILDIIAIAVKL